MIRKYWEIKNIEKQNKKCEICGRKITHIFEGQWEYSLFGRWADQVKEWENEEKIVSSDGHICEKCKMGI